MTIRIFLKLVEIQTKAASVIPFLLGTAYALYRFNNFKLNNFFIMLVSLVSIDMATTAINNYYDFKNAKKKYGYNYEHHNVIVKDNISEKKVIAIILILLLVAIIFGIILYINTNMLILILGGVSFSVGILYSCGVVPISRTPFGEMFSGFFMGFVIIFISIYIHVFDQNYIIIEFKDMILNFHADVGELIKIFLFSIPSVFGIANIMLANNICDIEDDTANHRFTLPICIGKNKALRLFSLLYYFIFFDLIILVLLKFIPLFSITALLTIFPVIKHIRIFSRKQSKKKTFILSVKNFILINITLLITLGISVIVS